MMIINIITDAWGRGMRGVIKCVGLEVEWALSGVGIDTSEWIGEMSMMMSCLAAPRVYARHHWKSYSS